MPTPLAEVRTSIQVPASRRWEESQQRRQRILEAARSCFGRLGFGGGTVEAIASQAGVSTGLLYQFFRSKQHLFEVVVEEVIRDWVRAIVAGDESLTPTRRLEVMFRNSVEFCRGNPLLPALLTRDRLLQLHRLGAERGGLDRIDAYRDLVARVLRDGVEAGEFRDDLEIPSVADLVCQLHTDYSSRAYRRDPQFPANPELIDAGVRFIHDAVRAR